MNTQHTNAFHSGFAKGSIEQAVKLLREGRNGDALALLTAALTVLSYPQPQQAPGRVEVRS